MQFFLQFYGQTTFDLSKTSLGHSTERESTVYFVDMEDPHDLMIGCCIGFLSFFLRLLHTGLLVVVCLFSGGSY